jgi:hypothetical protein
MEKKIGIDFHGVISAAPDIFATFTQALRKYGIKVYIITGGPVTEIKKYLELHKVEYDVVWAILDFYEAKGDVRFYEDGSFEVPTKLWNEAKAKYCEEEHIQLHIDDSKVYGKYFVTPYCQYDIATKSCLLKPEKALNFNEPERAAQTVFNLFSENA